MYFFSFSAPVFSRGTPRRVGPARQAKGCFLRGSQETSLYRFVSWGDCKPGGRRSRSRSPQCRQRAGVFPSSPCPRERGAFERRNEGREIRDRQQEKADRWSSINGAI